MPQGNASEPPMLVEADQRHSFSTCVGALETFLRYEGSPRDEKRPIKQLFEKQIEVLGKHDPHTLATML